MFMRIYELYSHHNTRLQQAIPLMPQNFDEKALYDEHEAVRDNFYAFLLGTFMHPGQPKLLMQLLHSVGVSLDDFEHDQQAVISRITSKNIPDVVWQAFSSSMDDVMERTRPLPLPRNTWLIHFTDNAREVAVHGFKHGINSTDIDDLYASRSEDKPLGPPGYNFAFVAGRNFESDLYGNKMAFYGRDAVLFQNSGIEVYHFGDGDKEVIFWGPDVSPKTIIWLTRGTNGWSVMAHPSKANRAVYAGKTIEQCIEWVRINQTQYRRLIYAI